MTGRATFIEQSQFNPEALELGPMPENDLWESICSILNEAGKPLPAHDETLGALREIDPDRRPLFAAFAADAIAERGNIRAWDRDRLLRDVLNGEREHHWRAAGITEDYENLLCLVTMTTGRLRVAALPHLPATLGVPPIDEFSRQRYEAMVSAPIGTDEHQDLLPALTPDLLGEFFVLENLTPSNPWTAESAASFRDAAWTLSPYTALAFGEFLARTIDDFFGHPTLSILLDLKTNDDHQRAFWSILAVPLINRYGELEEFDHCEQLSRRLTDISCMFEDEEILLQLALHEPQVAGPATRSR